jgi:FAD:protein FMN transferase
MVRVRRLVPCLAFVVALPLASCSSDAGAPGAAGDLVITSFTGATMGSTYQVKLVGAAEVAKVRTIVEAELAAYDAAFSNWRGDSEIARVNAHASTEPFAVSERFAAVLQLALDVAVATEGAFDPTVKPLTDLYRAAKRDPQHRLDAPALAAARDLVDHRRVQLRDGAVVKARGDVQLDLDGLVAGAAIDAILARLVPLQLQGVYLEVTGEVACRGEKAPGVPWRIGVVDPATDANGGDVPIRTLALRDRALCTSGDYRNAFVAGGELIHHVFDPRTGASARRGIASASVLAPSAALADALGTAMLVLGEDDTRRLWPSFAKLGASAALLLLPASDGTLRAVELAWPKDDS